MARQDALGIVLASDGSTKDKLAEIYGAVIARVQKSALSMQLKSTNFSGDPSTGSVEFKRFVNSIVRAKGTARTAGTGDKLQNTPVTVNIDQSGEIVEEFQLFDVDTYGVPELLLRRAIDHVDSMAVTLDTAFFAQAESAGSEVPVESSDTIVEKLETVIQSIETTSNSYVNGVDRSRIVVSVLPSVYGQLENYIDALANPNNGGVDVKLFHGVRIYSNTRQTKDVIAMVDGAIAQPVKVREYREVPVQFDDAVAVQLFMYYGTKALTADLIKWADLSEEVSA